jgi:archaemetzincin
MAVAFALEGASTRAMTLKTQRRRIAIAPVGHVEPTLVDWVAEDVRAVLGRDVIVAAPLPLPGEAFSGQRDQWRAAVVLDALAQERRPDWLRLLGIADVDLYAPELNFVFGQADERRGVAVFSTARLRLGGESTGPLRRRGATEAIHELGHTFGLSHCSRPRCVMWFSNTLEETDRKDVHPCAEHARALARALDAAQ